MSEPKDLGHWEHGGGWSWWVPGKDACPKCGSDPRGVAVWHDEFVECSYCAPCPRCGGAQVINEIQPCWTCVVPEKAGYCGTDHGWSREEKQEEEAA
jgi:hypothetical protein